MSLKFRTRIDNFGQLERGDTAETHVSQAPISVEVSLPVTTKAGSTSYRSEHDPENDYHKLFLLVDTPGHGKLRQHAVEAITTPKNLKGIIFMVDASSLSVGGTGDSSSGLKETAQYLHDILLVLQTSLKSSNSKRNVPVLVAANKSDLFTSLPPTLVKDVLESEITLIRKTRSAGLLDSGIDMDQDTTEPDQDALGEETAGRFDFEQLGNLGIEVDVQGGNVIGSEGASVQPWWEWIARQL
jgi:signal recognition particle receptor subunit beta